MGTQRESLQVGGAVAFLIMLALLMRWLAGLRLAQPAGGLTVARAQLLVVALAGVMVVGLALWGTRNRLGAGLIAGALSVVVLTSPVGLVHLSSLTRLWQVLSLFSNWVLPPVFWGAAVATWGASVYLARPSSATKPSTESSMS